MDLEPDQQQKREREPVQSPAASRYHFSTAEPILEQFNIRVGNMDAESDPARALAQIHTQIQTQSPPQAQSQGLDVQEQSCPFFERNTTFASLDLDLDMSIGTPSAGCPDPILALASVNTNTDISANTNAMDLAHHRHRDFQYPAGESLPRAVAESRGLGREVDEVAANRGAMDRGWNENSFAASNGDLELDAWRRVVGLGARGQSEAAAAAKFAANLLELETRLASTPLEHIYVSPWNAAAGPHKQRTSHISLQHQRQRQCRHPFSQKPSAAMDSSSAEQHEYYPPPPQQAYYSTSTTHLSDHPTLHTPQHSQPQPQHLGPQQDFAPVYSPQSEYDAEADLKRLRNTAASARFRAKKKQREQTLEMQAREKKTALEKLEARIQELERENRFLKGLIMGPREEELKELKKQRDEAIADDRKGIEHKDGVGTD
ncbi:hypothetical protein B2J93_9400 [Marssonina coronariae]|uniref:BZIP domain-containing protein n=1 Tax=Diplocarpon coronariae TaxID=2795749 RepID=A0A218Z9B6_9HELO|nr:hypothetical protein B2J93_9400 [Marssonina coronariae]